jgi:phage terminase small subunit
MPPKPTPTAKLAARGSWRAKVRDGEPMPPVSPSLPPSELEGRPADIWESLAPSLHAAGLLTDADYPAFRRYCRLTAVWETAMVAVEKTPERQAILALAKLEDAIRKLDAAFGLTPADRPGLAVPKSNEGDSKTRFFKSA